MLLILPSARSRRATLALRVKPSSLKVRLIPRLCLPFPDAESTPFHASLTTHLGHLHLTRSRRRHLRSFPRSFLAATSHEPLASSSFRKSPRFPVNSVFKLIRSARLPTSNSDPLDSRQNQNLRRNLLGPCARNLFKNLTQTNTTARDPPVPTPSRSITPTTPALSQTHTMPMRLDLTRATRIQTEPTLTSPRINASNGADNDVDAPVALLCLLASKRHKIAAWNPANSSLPNAPTPPVFSPSHTLYRRSPSFPTPSTPSRVRTPRPPNPSSKFSSCRFRPDHAPISRRINSYPPPLKLVPQLPTSVRLAAHKRPAPKFVKTAKLADARAKQVGASYRLNSWLLLTTYQ
ncbi:hypothetical protein R3P38DRAFT_3262868 [Favolaschia claudopus]|uniref:Uncharacterized protein n=1 Tax=Favolaschia claudopus TaxID=2862362 RepID=A0AAW0CJH6_9AGAR